MKTDTDNDVDAPASDDRLHTKDLLDQPDVTGAASAEPETSEARDAVPLFDDASALDTRWHEIQTRFVDEPRQAVEDADALVAEVMRRLAESFSYERVQLEDEWKAGDEVSTENLRLALQRYRSFFHRLLAA
jgi:hypothetical protein